MGKHIHKSNHIDHVKMRRTTISTISSPDKRLVQGKVTMETVKLLTYASHIVRRTDERHVKKILDTGVKRGYMELMNKHA